MSRGIYKEIDLFGGITADGYGDGYTADVSTATNYSVQLIVSSPNSPSGCTVTLSSSNNGTNWVAGTPVNVTVATTAFLTIPTNFAKYIKVTKVLASGSVVIKALLVTVVELP